MEEDGRSQISSFQITILRADMKSISPTGPPLIPDMCRVVLSQSGVMNDSNDSHCSYKSDVITTLSPPLGIWFYFYGARSKEGQRNPASK
ncbi:hypothetical protein Btru_034440 [Bulinus truncatus]|nr:hypothetical protein Btru_034440 [Bulinus truncatus]